MCVAFIRSPVGVAAIHVASIHVVSVRAAAILVASMHVVSVSVAAILVASMHVVSVSVAAILVASIHVVSVSVAAIIVVSLLVPVMGPGVFDSVLSAVMRTAVPLVAFPTCSPMLRTTLVFLAGARLDDLASARP
jgi:hypothetical protein